MPPIVPPLQSFFHSSLPPTSPQVEKKYGKSSSSGMLLCYGKSGCNFEHGAWFRDAKQVLAGCPVEVWKKFWYRPNLATWTQPYCIDVKSGYFCTTVLLTTGFGVWAMEWPQIHWHVLGESCSCVCTTQALETSNCCQSITGVKIYQCTEIQ